MYVALWLILKWSKIKGCGIREYCTNVFIVTLQDEGEDEEQTAEDDEEDDGFFVPHGYLSDGEGCASEGEEESISAEQLKARKLAKAKSWDAEMKSKVTVLQPVCVGCLWWNPDMTKNALNQTLAAYQVTRRSIEEN